MITKQLIRNDTTKSEPVELKIADVVTRHLTEKKTEFEKDDLFLDEYALKFFETHCEATTFTSSAPRDGIYIYKYSK
jgi:hypothetical protein